LSAPDRLAPPRSGLVAIVGRPNVGKSTLLNRLVGEKVAIVSSKPQTTRNRILGVVNRPGGQIVLFDTPGIHKPQHEMNQRMVDAAIHTLGQVDIALWVVDITQPPGTGDHYVKERLAAAGRPVLLGINKIDRVPKPRILPAIDSYREMLDFVEIVPLSALTGDNVELLAERLLARLPEGEPLYPADYLTDQPERFLVAEMVRERILEHTREELPYSVGVLVDSFEELPRLVRIHASVLVERPGQKGILIGKGGAMLKRVGSEARSQIERLLGVKVYLELFVKVRPRWREDPKVLDEIGLARR
jgi:GTPase